jgi:hypothetical protein
MGMEKKKLAHKVYEGDAIHPEHAATTSEATLKRCAQCFKRDLSSRPESDVRQTRQGALPKRPYSRKTEKPAEEPSGGNSEYTSRRERKKSTSGSSSEYDNAELCALLGEDDGALMAELQSQNDAPPLYSFYRGDEVRYKGQGYSIYDQDNDEEDYYDLATLQLPNEVVHHFVYASDLSPYERFSIGSKVTTTWPGSETWKDGVFIVHDFNVEDDTYTLASNANAEFLATGVRADSLSEYKEETTEEEVVQVVENVEKEGSAALDKSGESRDGDVKKLWAFHKRQPKVHTFPLVPPTTFHGSLEEYADRQELSTLRNRTKKERQAHARSIHMMGRLPTGSGSCLAPAQEYRDMLWERNEEIIKLKEELNAYRKTELLLEKHGGPPLLEATLQFVARPFIEFGHPWIQSTGWGLRNAVVVPNGGNPAFSRAAVDMASVAAGRSSGGRALDDLHHGGIPRRPNSFSGPGRQTAMRNLDENHPDRKFTVGISMKMIQHHLEASESHGENDYEENDEEEEEEEEEEIEVEEREGVPDGGGGEEESEEESDDDSPDDPHRGGEPGLWLSYEHITDAADELNDSQLKKAALCAFDKHSQAVTSHILCSTNLWKKLRERGHLRDSVVLKTLGRAQQAWSRPGLTWAARTKALFLQQALVYRAMGEDLYDVRTLTGSHYAGFPTHQLIDLIGVVDVRNQAMARCPEQMDPRFLGNSETWLTTRSLESSFGAYAANLGGRKPDAEFVFGRTRHLEAATQISSNSDKAWNVRGSKRKWHNDENFTDAKYNDGSNMSWNQDSHAGWYKQLSKRAKAASRNRGTVRSWNRGAGGA